MSVSCAVIRTSFRSDPPQFTVFSKESNRFRSIRLTVLGGKRTFSQTRRLQCGALRSAIFARSVLNCSVPNSKQPFAIRMLTWFAALASAGMYLSILFAVCDIGPHIMGGERVTRTEWLNIAALLVGAMGVLMALVCSELASGKPWWCLVAI